MLDVPVGASMEVVREKYRLLAMAWHPDRFEASKEHREQAQTILSRVNAAFGEIKQFWKEEQGAPSAPVSHSCGADTARQADQTAAPDTAALSDVIRAVLGRRTWSDRPKEANLFAELFISFVENQGHQSRRMHVSPHIPMSYRSGIPTRWAHTTGPDRVLGFLDSSKKGDGTTGLCFLTRSLRCKNKNSPASFELDYTSLSPELQLSGLRHPGFYVVSLAGEDQTFVGGECGLDAGIVVVMLRELREASIRHS